MKRILSGLIVGIMVLSAFAFLATPAMGDVVETGGAGPQERTWTAYFNDNNMWRDPSITVEDHPLAINEKGVGGGGGLFYLGDQDAIYSFSLELDADIEVADGPVEFAIIDSDLEIIPGDMRLPGEAWSFPLSVAELAAGSYDFQGRVSIVENAPVETFYGMGLRIFWAAGTAFVDINIWIYVSSIGHDTGSPDTRFEPELARADGNLFMPYDSFESAEMELTPQGGYEILADIDVDLTMPAGFTEFGNGEFMDPNDWTNGVTQTIGFRVDVDPGVPAGEHWGFFTWEYSRDVGGAVVDIIEVAVPFTIYVDFNPYVSADLVADVEIVQGKEVVEFEVTFENEGNVNLYGVKVTVDTSAGDLWEYAFQHEQGTGGAATTEPPQEYWLNDGGAFNTGDDDNVDIHLFVAGDIEEGTHHIPLIVEGYYFNDGSLGDPTGIVEFQIRFVAQTGNLVPERDPFMNLRARLTLDGVNEGFYDFGAWIHFEVVMGDDPAFTVTADFEAIYIGGESQTENITIAFEIECTTAEWNMSVSSIILMGGSGTPFEADATGVIPKEGQDEMWDDASVFLVLFTVSLNDDVFAGDWSVPVEITTTYEATGLEYAVVVWTDVTVEDLDIGVELAPGAANLYIEERTINILREYTIDNNMDSDLKDVFVTIHIGDDTPFLVAGHHPDVQEITLYAGGIASGEDAVVEFDMNLNEDTHPGTYDVRLTVWGTVDDINQLVLLSDEGTTVIERLFPEPSDLFLSEMRMGDIIPGEQFEVEFVIENLGGQRAHNIQVDFSPAELFDFDFDVLNNFLESIQVAYVDTTNDGNNRIRTDQWQVDQMSNISFANYPGEWFLTLNESLALFGMDDAMSIYNFEDWIHRSRSSPRPAIYSFRIDTLGAGDSVTITMMFNADQEMIPGRVYAEEWFDNIMVDITWFDEEDNFNEWSTDVSMMIEHSARPGHDDIEGSSVMGDLGTGLLALVVVLLVIIIVLMLLAWSELRKPYEDDEFDMDHMEEEEIMSSPEPEPEPLDEFVEAPEPEVLDEPPVEDEDKF